MTLVIIIGIFERSLSVFLFFDFFSFLSSLPLFPFILVRLLENDPTITAEKVDMVKIFPCEVLHIHI